MGDFAQLPSLPHELLCLICQHCEPEDLTRAARVCKAFAAAAQRALYCRLRLPNRPIKQTTMLIHTLFKTDNGHLRGLVQHLRLECSLDRELDIYGRHLLCQQPICTANNLAIVSDLANADLLDIALAADPARVLEELLSILPNLQRIDVYNATRHLPLGCRAYWLRGLGLPVRRPVQSIAHVPHPPLAKHIRRVVLQRFHPIMPQELLVLLGLPRLVALQVHILPRVPRCDGIHDDHTTDCMECSPSADTAHQPSPTDWAAASEALARLTHLDLEVSLLPVSLVLRMLDGCHKLQHFRYRSSETQGSGPQLSLDEQNAGEPHNVQLLSHLASAHLPLKECAIRDQDIRDRPCHQNNPRLHGALHAFSNVRRLEVSFSCLFAHLAGGEVWDEIPGAVSDLSLTGIAGQALVTFMGEGGALQHLSTRPRLLPNLSRLTIRHHSRPPRTITVHRRGPPRTLTMTVPSRSIRTEDDLDGELCRTLRDRGILFRYRPECWNSSSTGQRAYDSDVESDGFGDC